MKNLGVHFRSLVAPTAIAVLLVFVDPFGFGAALKSVGRDAFINITATNYRTNDEYKIAVVLIDDEFINYQTAGWPLPLGVHGDIFTIISAGQPEAIFYDIAFIHDRPDLGEPLLLDAIGRASLQAPVFLLAGSPELNAVQYARSSMRCENQSVISSLFCAQKEAGRIEYVHGLYRQSETGIAAIASPDQMGNRAAARAIADAALPQSRGIPDRIQPLWPGVPFGCHAEDPDLVWAAGPNVCSRIPLNPLQRAAELFIGNALGVFDADIFYSQNEGLAPYTTVTAQELILFDAEASEALKDAYVFVGTQLGVIEDVVTSPVYGNIPGVYVHAVTFDNIISTGYNPLSSPRQSDIFIELAGVVFTMLMIISVRILFVFIFPNMSSSNFYIYLNDIFVGVIASASFGFFAMELLRSSPEVWLITLMSLIAARIPPAFRAARHYFLRAADGSGAKS